MNINFFVNVSARERKKTPRLHILKFANTVEMFDVSLSTLFSLFQQQNFKKIY
jgi:hypothetical protein